MKPKPYNFVVLTDGEDTVLRNGKATRYGGTDDKQDNGIGAWGFNSHKFPGYFGIALPIISTAGDLHDSPLGHIPGGTLCRVFSRLTGKSVYVHTVDIGPSKETGRVADLMNSVVKALGLELETGVYDVDIRVFGGAKYLPHKA